MKFFKSVASLNKRTWLGVYAWAFSLFLFLYTAQANIELLIRVYPSPIFVFFGLLSFEVGALYWQGHFHMFKSDMQKRVAFFMCCVDLAVSFIGFYISLNQYIGDKTSSNILVSVVTLGVILNVGLAMMLHFHDDERAYANKISKERSKEIRVSANSTVKQTVAPHSNPMVVTPLHTQPLQLKRGRGRPRKEVI